MDACLDQRVFHWLGITYALTLWRILQDADILAQSCFYASWVWVVFVNVRLAGGMVVGEIGERSQCMQHSTAAANENKDLVTHLCHEYGKEGTGDRNRRILRVTSVEDAL